MQPASQNKKTNHVFLRFLPCQTAEPMAETWGQKNKKRIPYFCPHFSDCPSSSRLRNSCRTTKLSDRRWKRAQAVSDDVHKSSHVKTETLSGGSSPAICWALLSSLDPPSGRPLRLCRSRISKLRDNRLNNLRYPRDLKMDNARGR